MPAAEALVAESARARGYTVLDPVALGRVAERGRRAQHLTTGAAWGPARPARRRERGGEAARRDRDLDVHLDERGSHRWLRPTAAPRSTSALCGTLAPARGGAHKRTGPGPSFTTRGGSAPSEAPDVHAG